MHLPAFLMSCHKPTIIFLLMWLLMSLSWRTSNPSYRHFTDFIFWLHQQDYKTIWGPVLKGKPVDNKLVNVSVPFVSKYREYLVSIGRCDSRGIKSVQSLRSNNLSFQLFSVIRTIPRYRKVHKDRHADPTGKAQSVGNTHSFSQGRIHRMYNSNCKVIMPLNNVNAKKNFMTDQREYHNHEQKPVLL